MEEEVEPEIRCHLPAFLPEDYVADTGERLVIYKRLSSVATEEELIAMQHELRDRFGPPSPTVKSRSWSPTCASAGTPARMTSAVAAHETRKALRNR